jgi:Co/Zn/Cd efflux system component
MAHYRKPLGTAVVLNTAIFIVEAVAGLRAQSLSLLMDSVHNLSDEAALLFMFLAFVLPLTLSSALQRWANLLNSLGLVAVSGLMIWQAVERLVHPVPVLGRVPMAIGLLAAAANWGVARLLLEPSRRNPTIRLAYLHNLGDVLVSLAPVAAGALITLTGRSFFDPLIALLIAAWILWSTALEVLQSREELIWPEQIVCGHDQDKRSAAA